MWEKEIAKRYAQHIYSIVSASYIQPNRRKRPPYEESGDYIPTLDCSLIQDRSKVHRRQGCQTILNFKSSVNQGPELEFGAWSMVWPGAPCFFIHRFLRSPSLDFHSITTFAATGSPLESTTSYRVLIDGRYKEGERVIIYHRKTM